MKHRVFVFGTLKEGFPNFATNRGTRLQGSFTTVDRFPFYLVGDRHSPWLVNAPGQGSSVVGQIFEVDDEALAAMDKLERIAEVDGYRRIELTVRAVESSAVISVYAYLKQPKHFEPSQVRLGPLSEYTLDHAALYRPRAY